MKLSTGTNLEVEEVTAIFW